MDYFVRGATNINKDGFGDVRRIEEIIMHPQFDLVSFENDLAILQLEKVCVCGLEVP